MDCPDGRIAKRHSGQQGAEQHLLARHEIMAITHRCRQVGIQDLQGFQSQHIRDRISFQYRRQRFDRMNHGVYPGHGRNGWRQASGQLAVKQCQIGQQQGRHHGLLLVPGRGDHGDPGDFGPGASRGRNLDQWQPWPACESSAVDVLQELRRAQQQGHQLRRVE